MTPQLLRLHIYDVICIGAWQTAYVMLYQFSMILQTEILSTEISNFLKQFFSSHQREYHLHFTMAALLFLSTPYGNNLTISIPCILYCYSLSTSSYSSVPSNFSTNNELNTPEGVRVDRLFHYQYTRHCASGSTVT